MIDYISSDLHLGHEYIVEKRPFESVSQMDSLLIDYWNTVVDENDTVLYLGDIAMVPEEEQRSYLGKLNGNILFVRGNHDDLKNTMDSNLMIFDSLDFTESSYGVKFHATHKPFTIPENIRWLLHGHTHMNNIREYPFYHPNKNTMNFCVEVTGYTPVSFDKVVDTIKTQNQIIEKIRPPDEIRNTYDIY